MNIALPEILGLLVEIFYTAVQTIHERGDAYLPRPPAAAQTADASGIGTLVAVRHGGGGFNVSRDLKGTDIAAT